MRSTPLAIVSLLLCLSTSLLGCVVPAGDAPADQDGYAADMPLLALHDEEPPANRVRPAAAVEPTSSRYPAPHPGMPEIPRNGGVVLHDPRIVTVTFPGDPWRSNIEAFGDQIGDLDWWSTVHDGYGVGRAESAGHVAMNEAPPRNLADGQIRRWLAARIGDRSLPEPTDQSIYLLYYPASTTVTVPDGGGGAASCQTFLGYHAAIEVAWRGAAIPVAYAVINRCSEDFDQLTTTASHELTEASTDPHPNDPASMGYVTLQDSAWTLLGGENGDMCASVGGTKEAGWALTRVWNNPAASAGQQPCLPAPRSDVPYFNAGVVQERLEVPPGGYATAEVDCYSFGPLPAPIALEAQGHARGALTFSFDRQTCTNGDKVTMTVGLDARAQRGAAYYYSLFTSVRAGGAAQKATHIWRGVVHVY